MRNCRRCVWVLSRLAMPGLSEYHLRSPSWRDPCRHVRAAWSEARLLRACGCWRTFARVSLSRRAGSSIAWRPSAEIKFSLMRADFNCSNDAGTDNLAPKISAYAFSPGCRIFAYFESETVSGMETGGFVPADCSISAPVLGADTVTGMFSYRRAARTS